jgi:hypothetical protein
VEVRCEGGQSPPWAVMLRSKKIFTEFTYMKCIPRFAVNGVAQLELRRDGRNCTVLCLAENYARKNY